MRSVLTSKDHRAVLLQMSLRVEYQAKGSCMAGPVIVCPLQWCVCACVRA